jgi:hypothetical protein
MVSRDGRPFLGHVATATSTGIDKTSPQDSPGVPASSYPIKGQARALQGGGMDEQSQKPSTSKQRQKINISSNLPCTLTFPLETWARFPLSQLVTPTQALRCKEIQYSPPAGCRALFCSNQDKFMCILLASPSRLGTRNTHSLA